MHTKDIVKGVKHTRAYANVRFCLAFTHSAARLLYVVRKPVGKLVAGKVLYDSSWLRGDTKY